MSRFFDALKAGYEGFKDGIEPAEFSIAGRPIQCPHCGHRKFASGRALLNAKLRTMFNLDWADPPAAILVCAECSRIEWFASQPEEGARD